MQRILNGEEMGADRQIFQFPGDTNIDVKQVGGKAHSLIKSVASGLPVPHGFVLSVEFFKDWFSSLKETSAWQDFLDANVNSKLRSACNALKTEAMKLEFSADQKSAVVEAFHTLNSHVSMFAVRSSSPEEDLSGSSFAGGYETILGVTQTTFEEAVKTAFASCLDMRVVVYKQQNGFNYRDPKIAVVVQEQIASDVAGVAFSLNPVTNNFDQAVINSNWGLGETVVAGIATPDTFIVDKVQNKISEKKIGGKETSIWLLPDGGTEERSDSRSEEVSLSDSQILAITALVVSVENNYACPMDIEWAYANDQLFLLQARPITTYVPLVTGLETAPYERKRLYLDVTICVQGLFKPISVMGTSFLKKTGSYFTKKLFGKDLLEDIDDAFGFVSDGRLYCNVSNVFEVVGKDNAVKAFTNLDPAAAKIIAAVSEDEYRSRNKEIKRVPFHLLWQLPAIGLHVLEARLLPEHAQRDVEHEVKDYLHDVDHLAQQNLPLLELHEQLVERLQLAIFGHVMPAFLTSRIALQRLKSIAEEDRITDEFNDLERALPNNPTTQMGLALYRMSKLLPENIELKSVEERLAGGDLPPQFIAAWHDFLKTYGHRGPIELDIASPRFREQPGTLLAQIVTLRQSASADDNPQDRFDQGQMKRKEAFESICEKLHNHGWLAMKNLSSLYRAYEILGGYREMPKFLVIYAMDAMRQHVLKDAQNLFSAGRLDSVQQVFDLTLEQLEQANSDPLLDLRALASANRVVIDKLSAVPQLPTVMNSRGEILTAPTPPAKEGEVVGTGVSSGVFRGPVKVLHTPDEKPLNRGDVLVARATDPGWTPLFVNAGAVILEVGGMLQHGALVAREYGLPCVTGIAGATSLWQDGTLVEVDGAAGVVRIVESL